VRIAREGPRLELERSGHLLRIAREGPRLWLARDRAPDDLPANVFVTSTGEPLVTTTGDFLVAS
jgi:hypothetical protein